MISTQRDMNRIKEIFNTLQKTLLSMPVRDYIDWLKSRMWVHRFLLLTVAFLPAFYLLLVSVVLPLGKIGIIPGFQLPEKTSGDSTTSRYTLSGQEQESWHSYLAAEQAVAIRKHRLSLAAKDSIYLRICLPDSTMHLEIKGVAIYSSKMLELRLGVPFENTSPQLMAQWASMPFVMEHRNATIDVFPVVYKDAPKDTAEANALPSEPMPPEKTAVYFDLRFDRGLRLLVEQNEEPDRDDRKIVHKYLRRERREQWRLLLAAARRAQPFLPEMTIRFKLPEEDARALYRALPEQAHLLVQY